MAERSEIRREVRQRRRALPARERREYSERIAARVAALPEFLHGRHIALYLPNDGEVDPTPLFDAASAGGKHWYLPVLGLPYENRLWFMPYGPGTRLTRNRFGIPEPATRRRTRARKAWGLDLVLAPLVAFDAAGHRLGMGGGFYDRSLGFMAHRRRWYKPRLIGLAYECQRVNALPAAEWDVPLHGIVTEQRVYRTRDLRSDL